MHVEPASPWSAIDEQQKTELSNKPTLSFLAKWKLSVHPTFVKTKIQKQWQKFGL